MSYPIHLGEFAILLGIFSQIAGANGMPLPGLKIKETIKGARMKTLEINADAYPRFYNREKLEVFIEEANRAFGPGSVRFSSTPAAAGVVILQLDSEHVSDESLSLDPLEMEAPSETDDELCLTPV